MRRLRPPTAVALFSTVLVAFALLAGAEVTLDGGKTGRPRSTERHQQTVQNKTAPSVKDAQEEVESGAVEELWAVSDRGGDDAAMARAPLIVSSASTASSPIAPKTSTTKRRGPLSRIMGMFGILEYLCQPNPKKQAHEAGLASGEEKRSKQQKRCCTTISL